MAKFAWTPKRVVALKCLVLTMGNTRLAAEESKAFYPSVSEAYLETLKYGEKYIVFREEYKNRTGDILNALEVDESYVLEGFRELSKPGHKDSVRLGAYEKLGDYLGIWAPTKEEVTYHAPEIVEVRSDEEKCDTAPGGEPASRAEGDMG